MLKEAAHRWNSGAPPQLRANKKEDATAFLDTWQGKKQGVPADHERLKPFGMSTSQITVAVACDVGNLKNFDKNLARVIAGVSAEGNVGDDVNAVITVNAKNAKHAEGISLILRGIAILAEDDVRVAAKPLVSGIVKSAKVVHETNAVKLSVQAAGADILRLITARFGGATGATGGGPQW